MSAETIPDDVVDQVADIIDQNELGYSITLTRLVDGIETWTLAMDGETHEFDFREDAAEVVATKRRRLQAARVIEATAAILATRPAEPAAPVAEAGSHPDAMRRPWELRSPTQIYGNLQRDQNGTADRVAVTTTHADAALIVEAVNAYSPLRSALEAERARADAAEQRAADALVRAEKAEDWQPIETAKAGELLLLFEPHSMGGFIFVGALNGVWFNNLDQKIQKPTMWRPLPAPPRASREAQPATDGGDNG